MRQYKASGIAPLSGILTALIAGLIAAILMGGVLYAIEHYTGFYMIIAFSLVSGALVGYALSKAVRVGKIRNSAVAAGLGLLAALALTGTYHLAKYQLEFRDDARQFLISNNQAATEAAINKTTDEYLKSETGATGFLGYLQLEAKEGISITRVSSNSSSGTFKDIWFWVYSAVEFVIVAAIAAGGAWGAAKEPFNEARGQWYGDAQVILTAPGESAKELNAALKSGAYESAGALLQREPLPLPRVELAVRQTQVKDPDNVVVTAHLVQQNGKNESRTKLANGLMTQLELERVLSTAVVSLEPVAG